MLEPALFDRLEAVARATRGCDAPFGGIQLVLAGDFHQLPPVARGLPASGDRQGPHALLRTVVDVPAAPYNLRCAHGTGWVRPPDVRQHPQELCLQVLLPDGSLAALHPNAPAAEANPSAGTAQAACVARPGRLLSGLPAGWSLGLWQPASAATEAAQVTGTLGALAAATLLCWAAVHA